MLNSDGSAKHDENGIRHRTTRPRVAVSQLNVTKLQPKVIEFSSVMRLMYICMKQVY